MDRTTPGTPAGEVTSVGVPTAGTITTAGIAIIVWDRIIAAIAAATTIIAGIDGMSRRDSSRHFPRKRHGSTSTLPRGASIFTV